MGIRNSCHTNQPNLLLLDTNVLQKTIITTFTGGKCVSHILSGSQ